MLTKKIRHIWIQHIPNVLSTNFQVKNYSYCREIATFLSSLPHHLTKNRWEKLGKCVSKTGRDQPDMVFFLARRRFLVNGWCPWAKNWYIDALTCAESKYAGFFLWASTSSIFRKSLCSTRKLTPRHTQGPASLLLPSPTPNVFRCLNTARVALSIEHIKVRWYPTLFFA